MMPMDQAEKNEFLKVLEDHHITHEIGWKNFSENIDDKPAIVAKIETIQQLQVVMRTLYAFNEKKAESERNTGRTAAGGDNKKYSKSFSFTACAEGEVILHLTGKAFKEIKPLAENIVLTGASVEVGVLARILYELYNLVLQAASLIPYVTVAGLAANAGHGSGRDQPSFAGLIAAMTLCLPNGDIVRIDANDENFETIRAAHLGLFGVVINMELQCIPAKKLKCEMDVRSLAELIEEVQQGLFINDPYVSVMYVPTYQPDELTNKSIKNVIIYRSTPVAKEENDVNMNAVLSHFGQDAEVEMGESLHITDLLRKHPNLIPDYMKYIVSQFAVGVKDAHVLGPWPDVTHYRTAFPRDIDDTDYLFEASADAKEIVAAITRVAESLTEFAKHKQYPITDAIYLRFFKGTNGGLSTSAHAEGRYICGFDMVSSNGMHGYKEFKNEMSHYFLNELNAKPHPGKFIPPEFNYRKAYGKAYDEFIKTLQDWHTKHHIELGKSPLLNAFHEQMLNNNVLMREEMDVPRQSVEVKKIAEGFKSQINMENPFAEILLKDLEEICRQPEAYARSSQTLFGGSTTDNMNNQSVEEKQRHCVIV